MRGPSYGQMIILTIHLFRGKERNKMYDDLEERVYEE